jgi:ribA/ribD-fused uncharacterized protein
MEEVIIIDCKNEYLESLSNYSDYSFLINGMNWRSIAHYYHFNKFDKFISKKAILFSKTAKEAEEIGRNRYEIPKGMWATFKQRGMNPMFKANWKELRSGVMTEGIRSKVLQNYDVRKVLLETEKIEILVHADSNYWGYQNNGQNQLGKVLMEIRDDLLKDGGYNDLENMMIPPWLKYPNISTVSIFWREGMGEYYQLKFIYWYQGLSPSSKLIYEEKYPAPSKYEESWYYIYHPREKK